MACGFHNYTPKQSVVVRLLNSRHVVLARPDPIDSYRYKIISHLKGDIKSDNIQDLVDSLSRRKLINNPEDAVLFAIESNSDDWKRLAYVDSSYRRIINTVSANFDRWSNGYHPERFKFFAEMLDHPNQVLQELALTEMDLAPYELLRNIKPRISPNNIISELWTIQGLPYVQIRILLLGISKSDIAREELRKNVTIAARTNHWSKSFGALATAFIEAEGAAGVERLAAYFLSHKEQPIEKAELVVEALAIHSQVGSKNLKIKITEMLKELVIRRPEIAALVARQFGKRNVWTQSSYLKKLVEKGQLVNSKQLALVESYLSQGNPSDRN